MTSILGRAAFLFIACLCLIARATSQAHSQGVSIVVDDVGGKLTVSGGIADTAGFAPMIFADGSDDAQLDHVNLPEFGNVALTDEPGFVVNLAQHSSMGVEFIPRPVRGTNPVEERLLWHWSAATQTVDLAPNDVSLNVASVFEAAVLRQPGSPVPLPIFAVHLLPEEIGGHVHFLRYMLDDAPPAATGAYGFFTRFNGSPFVGSPYETSDPLLIVLNNSLDESTLRTAALAINAAAADSIALPGDYDRNGSVDAADFVLWKNTLGSTVELAADGNENGSVDPADYNLWRENFGRSAGTSASPAQSGLPNSWTFAMVPEPRTGALAVAAALAMFFISSGRSTSFDKRD
jgi:hypothetical protein